MKSEFDIKLRELMESMVDISFEYVSRNKEEVDAIYIYCSTEESILFYFFYTINGVVTEKHKVNDFLEKTCDVSRERQISANRIGNKDLQSMIKLFKTYQKEVPTQIKMSYYPLPNKLESDFSYEKHLTSSDVMEEDLIDEWIKSIKG